MFKKVLLNNNIPLLMDVSREMHSVCIGIWVKVGSRYENAYKNGISHFLEHMFFKGTHRRSAREVATEADAIGAELNALTSSEYTLFYIRALNEYIERAIDLLTDIFINSTFPDEDIEKEKNIVIEEIKMVEDNPSDYIHDIFSKNLWGDQGIGQSVLGRKESIHAFTRDDLLDHIACFYGNKNIVLSCCGNFSEMELIGHLQDSIGKMQKQTGETVLTRSDFKAGINIITRDLSEVHICMGLEGLPYSSEHRYALHLLNSILGSGFSSRLFQNVRENRGLTYSIYSYHQAYHDTGLWAVYAGADSSKVNEVINLTADEIRSLSSSVTDEELNRAKTQLKGNLMLALESTSNRMTSIAKQEIYYGRYFSPKEIIAMVEEVTIDDIRAVAKRLIDDKPIALTIYGPVEENEVSFSSSTG